MNPRSCLDRLRFFAIQDRLIKTYRIALEQKQAELDRFKLEHFREVNGLLAAWLISHEHPEWDMRDELTVACREVGDQIAKLEEMFV